jgi:adenylosuccinate synthase
VLGNGVVLDPEVLCEELDELAARGRSPEGLRISGNAHLVMPWHRVLDQASELHLGALQIGTTRRGIGPAYADKAARIGIRVQDLLDTKILREKITTALELKNEQLGFMYGIGRLDAAAIQASAVRYAERLAPYIADVSLLVNEALDRGEAVLCEGAQGTLLDLDHGTYPFVTSSNPIAGGACVGLGIGPTRVGAVAGVAKAYLTRVGEGPFPSEASPEAAEALREAGAEFGTVTGRPRRCGWLDLVGLRYAARVNGFTELVLTKLDVLSGASEIPVCVAYTLRDGTVSEHFPAHQSDFHHAEPVWETLEGWNEPIDGARHFEDLPPAAQRYVAFVAERLGIPVGLVSVGQRRDQVLTADASTTAARALAST